MNRNTTIGAILLGAGAGILLGRLIPALAWLWPFGLIVAGVMMWRRLGGSLVQLGLVAASLSLALVGLDPLFGLAGLGLGERVVARFESSDAQEDAWRGLRRVVVVNAVGDISIEEDGDLELQVSYRRGRGGVQAPAELQASYDEGSRTLRVVGVEPGASERERRGLEASLELEVPPGVSVEASTDVGSIRLRGAENARLESDVGDIRVSDARGEVSARTRVGTVELSFDEPLQAPLEALTEVGDVRLTLPERSDATVRAVSELRQFAGRLERVTGDEQRLILGAGQHQVLLQSNVGKVEVRTR